MVFLNVENELSNIAKVVRGGVKLGFKNNSARGERWIPLGKVVQVAAGVEPLDFLSVESHRQRRRISLQLDRVGGADNGVGLLIIL